MPLLRALQPDPGGQCHRNVHLAELADRLAHVLLDRAVHSGGLAEWIGLAGWVKKIRIIRQHF